MAVRGQSCHEEAAAPEPGAAPVLHSGQPGRAMGVAAGGVGGSRGRWLPSPAIGPAHLHLPGETGTLLRPTWVARCRPFLTSPALCDFELDFIWINTRSGGGSRCGRRDFEDPEFLPPPGGGVQCVADRAWRCPGSVGYSLFSCRFFFYKLAGESIHLPQLLS